MQARRRRVKVPSLVDLSIALLARHAECVESWEGIPSPLLIKLLQTFRSDSLQSFHAKRLTEKEMVEVTQNIFKAILHRKEGRLCNDALLYLIVASAADS